MEQIQKVKHHVVGVWENTEKVFEETVAESFPNLRKETEIKIQDTEFQIRWTQREPHQQTLQVKCQKLKRILNAMGGRKHKTLLYARKPHKIIS